MFIWLLALLFLGVFGAIGFRSGSIRMAVALVGTWIALAAAGPVGRLIAPLVAKATKENLLVQTFMPALVAFLVIWVILYAVGFAAHRPVELYFKYREDDATRAGFERLNQAGGLFLGFAIAFILFFQAGKYIYAGGYLSAQVLSEERDPGWVKFGTTLRREMESTGWDRSFAPLDQTPERMYEVADMLGMLHENPAALARFRDYPEFIELADRQEFKDLGADTEYQELVGGKSGLVANFNDSRNQTLLGNQELVDRLLKVDFNDFRHFLTKTESPKYADDKIIGRWRIDVNAVLLQQRRTRQSITPTEFAAMRRGLTALLRPLRLHAYSNGEFVIKMAEAPAPPPVDPNDPNAVAAAGGVDNPYGMDPSLAARYGVAPAGRAPAAAAQAAPEAPAMDLGIQFADGGSWTRLGARYQITTGTEGNGYKSEATFDENGRLLWNLKEFNVVLYFVPTT